MKQVIPGGNNDALSNSATEYNSLMGGGAWDSTQIRSYQVIPTGGTLRKLRIKLSAAPTTNPYVFTIMKNGSATTLTCTVAVGSTTAEDSTHEVTFAAGDYVTIRSSYSSAPGNTPSAQWSTEWEGSTAGEYIILGNGYRSTATSYYCGIYNSSKLAIYTAEYQSTRNLMYPAGTYKKFYGYLSIQPSSGLVLTLRKDGVDTTQTFTISGTSQTGNDTTHTTSGSGIDGWSISFVESGNVAACYMGWGLVFCPTTDGDIPFSGNFPGPSADNQYHYLLGTKPTDSWLTVDAPRLITSAMTLKAMDVDLNAKCGAGASVIFTVYKNGSATAMTVSCPDNYGGEYIGDVSVEAGDVLSLRYDETGTPTTRPSVCIGILARMANTAKTVTDSLAVSESIAVKGKVSLFESLSLSEMLATFSGATVQPIQSGNVDTLNNAATEFNCLMGGGIWTTTENDRKAPIPTPGKLRNFRVKLSAAPTSNPYKFTVRKNGADTALTVTVAVGSTTAQTDGGTEVSFAAGDLVCLKSHYDSAPGNTPYASWGIDWVPTSSDEFIILGNCHRDVLTTYYVNVMCQEGEATDTEYTADLPCPTTAGFFKNLCFYLAAAPTNALKLTVRKGQVDTSLAVTISGSNQSGNDTAHTVSTSSDLDYLDMAIVETSGDVAAGCFAWGLVWRPNANHDLPCFMGFDGNGDNNVYYPFQGALQCCDWTSSDRPRLVSSAFKLSYMALNLNGEPGSGNTFTCTVVKNGTTTAMSISISGSNDYGTYWGDVFFSPGDTISIKSTIVGTPVVAGFICFTMRSTGATPISLTDSLAVSEALAVRVKAAIADSLAISESPGIHVHALVADSLAISESLGIKVKALITDTIALSEALSIHVHALVADTLNISEMVTRLNGNIQKLVTDALSIAESISVSAHLKVSDSLTLAEVLGVKARLAMADSLSLSDALALKAWLRITDMLSVNESLNAKALVKVQDSMTLAEVLGVKAWLRITDMLSVNDAVALKVTVKVLDSLTISEALALLQKIKVTDSLAISEVIDANEVILMILNMILGADLDLSMSTRSDLDLSMGLRSDLELAIAFEGGA